MKFQDDISNMNTYTHTHGHAETNMFPTFSKLGHNYGIIVKLGSQGFTLFLL